MGKDLDKKLQEHAKHQIYMLTVVFLAGMAVNVIGMPSDLTGTTAAISGVLTGLHIFIGIGLIIGGLLSLRLAYQGERKYRVLAWSGLASILIAFASGMIMMATSNDWWSFAMAVGFITAILAYGALMLRTRRA
jgi:O-antigen/teichoic acid export membrane protein